MNPITCKFGGTSLADAESIRVAAKILGDNPARRFVVPSAPGKRTPDDRKITDLLYAWHGMAEQGLDVSEPKGIISARFGELASTLEVCLDVDGLLDEIEAINAETETPDYIASRGEFLNGHLLAAYLGATFVDPAGCIKFTVEGKIDIALTDELLGEALRGEGRFVIPGFYGSLPNGEIRTFSRGGSDITGAIVARATQSACYENWTDVSGFLMADPRIVTDAKRIETITYQELRELAYMGATVLHDEAIEPVRALGIPIYVRNTNDPGHHGSKIVAHRESTEPVCGIAGRGGFSMINVEKSLMNKERGFGLKILTILEEYDLGWEHMPTGIDTISLIIKNEELDDHGPSIIQAIEERCAPDDVTLSGNLAMIATVGQGMNHHIGIAARLFSAVAAAKINLRVIDQGSSETNIIIGVEENDLEKAVRTIYDAFVT